MLARSGTLPNCWERTPLHLVRLKSFVGYSLRPPLHVETGQQAARTLSLVDTIMFESVIRRTASGRGLAS